jgi:hypothetical protein
VGLAGGALATTALWLVAAFVTPREDRATLQRFVDTVRPGGPGWRDFEPATGGGEPWPVPRGLLCMFLGCVAVYCALLGTGHVLYGDGVPGYTMLGAAVLAGIALAQVQRGSGSAGA